MNKFFGFKNISFYISFFIAINNNISLIAMGKSINLDQEEDLKILENLSNQALKNQEIKKFKFKKSKILCCVCDSTFKFLVLSFVILTMVSNYLVISKMIDGCGQMDTACHQCSNQLESAENLLALVQKGASLVVDTLEKCPAHKAELINKFIANFADFLNKCCYNK